MRWIDTHAHVTAEAFDADRTEVLRRARDAGVAILCVGDNLASSNEAIELVQGADDLWATAGVHPHYAHQAPLEPGVLETALEELLERPRVVAVGEVGLDYHYDFSPREVQQQVFRRQIRLARKVQKPLIIHNRKSDEDVVRILQEERAWEVGGVFHCFWGDEALAKTVLEMGFYIGVGGPVTFKKSDELRAVVKEVPRERIIVETDAPYLAPVPYRGRRNEPAYVLETAKMLAQLLEMSLDELADLTSRNARRLFRLG